MRLKQGWDLKAVLRVLAEARSSCENLYGQLSGPAADPRGSYLDWASSTADQLRQVFADRTVAEDIFSRRYWNVAASRILDRQASLIMMEIKAQSERLRELESMLQPYVSIGDRAGALVVLDTNVLLHYMRMEHVQWSKLVKGVPVRLVVPVLVLDEVDEKRYSDARRVRERARRATDPLDERQDELERSGFAAVAQSVTVEYLVDPQAHERRGHPDEALLDSAEFLAAAAGREVSLVTADRGLRVRTTARRGLVRAVLMPDDYSKDRGESGSEG